MNELKLRWQVFATCSVRPFESGVDIQAAEELRALNASAIVPMRMASRRVHRRQKSRKARPVPALPGYVFGGTSRGLHSSDVARCKHIAAPITQGDRPVYLKAHEISWLLESPPRGIFRDSYAEKRTERPEFRLGESVEVYAGAFRGLRGELHEIEGQFGKMLMPFLGRAVPVTVRLDELGVVTP